LDKQTKNVILALASLFVASLAVGKKVISWIAPIKAKITSPYGNRTLQGKTEFHNGIDLYAPEGTPIKAPADAIVSSVYEHAAGGRQMILTHANGFKTGYAHLSQWKKSIGSKVKQGDIIALSGKTGEKITGAHLHFTMRNEKGTFVNPANYVNVFA